MVVEGGEGGIISFRGLLVVGGGEVEFWGFFIRWVLVGDWGLGSFLGSFLYCSRGYLVLEVRVFGVGKEMELFVVSCREIGEYEELRRGGKEGGETG